MNNIYMFTYLLFNSRLIKINKYISVKNPIVVIKIKSFRELILLYFFIVIILYFYHSITKNVQAFKFFYKKKYFLLTIFNYF